MKKRILVGLFCLLGQAMANQLPQLPTGAFDGLQNRTGLRVQESINPNANTDEQKDLRSTDEQTHNVIASSLEPNPCANAQQIRSRRIIFDENDEPRTAQEIRRRAYNEQLATYQPQARENALKGAKEGLKKTAPWGALIGLLVGVIEAGHTNGFKVTTWTTEQRKQSAASLAWNIVAGTALVGGVGAVLAAHDHASYGTHHNPVELPEDTPKDLRKAAENGINNAREFSRNCPFTTACGIDKAGAVALSTVVGAFSLGAVEAIAQISNGKIDGNALNAILKKGLIGSGFGVAMASNSILNPKHSLSTLANIAITYAFTRQIPGVATSWTPRVLAGFGITSSGIATVCDFYSDWQSKRMNKR